MYHKCYVMLKTDLLSIKMLLNCEFIQNIHTGISIIYISEVCACDKALCFVQSELSNIFPKRIMYSRLFSDI